jgi:hypothetical protein
MIEKFDGDLHSMGDFIRGLSNETSRRISRWTSSWTFSRERETSRDEFYIYPLHHPECGLNAVYIREEFQREILSGLPRRVRHQLKHFFICLYNNSNWKGLSPPVSEYSFNIFSRGVSGGVFERKSTISLYGDISKMIEFWFPLFSLSILESWKERNFFVHTV